MTDLVLRTRRVPHHGWNVVAACTSTRLCRICSHQCALRLKARLLFQPGVVVVDVPWHLRSAGVTPHPETLHHTTEQQATAAKHPTSNTTPTDLTPPADDP